VLPVVETRGVDEGAAGEDTSTSPDPTSRVLQTPVKTNT